MSFITQLFNWQPSRKASETPSAARSDIFNVYTPVEKHVPQPTIGVYVENGDGAVGYVHFGNGATTSGEYHLGPVKILPVRLPDKTVCASYVIGSLDALRALSQEPMMKIEPGSDDMSYHDHYFGLAQDKEPTLEPLSIPREPSPEMAYIASSEFSVDVKKDKPLLPEIAALRRHFDAVFASNGNLDAMEAAYRIKYPQQRSA